MVNIDSLAERLIDLGYTSAQLYTHPENPPRDTAAARLSFTDTGEDKDDATQPQHQSLVNDIADDYKLFLIESGDTRSVHRHNSYGGRADVYDDIGYRGSFALQVFSPLRPFAGMRGLHIIRFFPSNADDKTRVKLFGTEIGTELRSYYESRFQKAIPIL